MSLHLKPHPGTNKYRKQEPGTELAQPRSVDERVGTRTISGCALLQTARHTPASAPKKAPRRGFVLVPGREEEEEEGWGWEEGEVFHVTEHERGGVAFLGGCLVA